MVYIEQMSESQQLTVTNYIVTVIFSCYLEDRLNSFQP